MAPIEPDLSNSNLRPLAIFASYLVAASGLTTFITRNVIYRSYKGLPPSQATRLRESKRRKHVYVFLGLAGASLATTWWHMLGFFSLSYRSWAHEMGQPLPERFWGENGAFGEGKTGLTLGRWLSDTELFRDAWEIVIERSQRYWWGQQIFFATAAWALYVSIEGKDLMDRLIEIRIGLTKRRTKTEHSSSVGIHASCTASGCLGGYELVLCSSIAYSSTIGTSF